MILCAAVKFHIDATDEDVVIPCRRHADAFQILKSLGFEPKKGYKEICQGFITTEGKFFDRQEAYVHAKWCGQLSHTTILSCEAMGKLFSEDLY